MRLDHSLYFSDEKIHSLEQELVNANDLIQEARSKGMTR